MNDIKPFSRFIFVYLRLFQTILGYLHSSRTNFGYLLLSATISDYIWLVFAISTYLCSFLCFLRSSWAISDCLWLLGHAENRNIKIDKNFVVKIYFLFFSFFLCDLVTKESLDPLYMSKYFCLKVKFIFGIIMGQE